MLTFKILDPKTIKFTPEFVIYKIKYKGIITVDLS
jgi:hypothetical protein